MCVCVCVGLCVACVRAFVLLVVVACARVCSFVVVHGRAFVLVSGFVRLR